MPPVKSVPRRVVLHPSCPACGASRQSYVSRLEDDDVACLMCGRSVVLRVERQQFIIEKDVPRRGRPSRTEAVDPSRVGRLQVEIVSLLGLNGGGPMEAAALAEALEARPDSREFLSAIDGLLISGRLLMVIENASTVQYGLVTTGAATA